MNVLIIGNGVAGVTCAAELRKRQPDPQALSIQIYSREAFPYYARIKLPETLGSTFSLEDIRMFNDEWYQKRDIQVFLGEEAQLIDTEHRTVSFSSGHVAEYDALILAQGAECIRPALPGASLDGTFVLREANDARRLSAQIKARNQSAIVLGGGLLGLEAARHLKEHGVQKVEVVEFFDRLLPRQLDQTAGLTLAKIMEHQGLGINLSCEAKAVLGTGKVEGLELKDGRTFTTQTLVFSMGVKPRIALAQRACIETKRGIIVNEFMETSIPGIYAVGDLAEFKGIVWGIIPAALEQAPVAAAAILGDKTKPYIQTVPRNTLKVAGVDVSSFGAVTDDKVGHPQARLSADGTRYEKYVLDDQGLLIGAIILGNKERGRSTGGRMGKPVSPREMDEWLSF